SGLKASAVTAAVGPPVSTRMTGALSTFGRRTAGWPTAGAAKAKRARTRTAREGMVQVLMPGPLPFPEGRGGDRRRAQEEDPVVVVCKRLVQSYLAGRRCLPREGACPGLSRSISLIISLV